MRAYAMAQRPSSVRPSGVNFFLQTNSSQEPLSQFQPNLVGNMLRAWGFRCVQIFKNLLLITTGRDALIFGMEHP